MKVLFKLDHPNAKLPTRGSTGAAGYDVYAAEAGYINPGQRALVPTGLRMAIQEGYECQVRPRSGLALKQGVTVLNTPGTIDEDYRGLCGVILMNHSSEQFCWSVGDRVAQFIFNEYQTPDFSVVDTLPETVRGEGGYGSTGVQA